MANRTRRAGNTILPPRDLGDSIREFHLTVVLGRIADNFARVGDTPEVVRIAAHAVENLEGYAVLIFDIRRLDTRKTRGRTGSALGRIDRCGQRIVRRASETRLGLEGASLQDCRSGRTSQTPGI